VSSSGTTADEWRAAVRRAEAEAVVTRGRKRPRGRQIQRHRRTGADAPVMHDEIENPAFAGFSVAGL